MTAAEQARRLQQILLVGHGAGLLLTFNARANGLPASGELYAVGVLFGFGVIAAYLTIYLAYRSQLYAEVRSESPNFIIPGKLQKDQEARRKWLNNWNLVSAISFGCALIIGLGFLGPRVQQVAVAVETTPVGANHHIDASGGPHDDRGLQNHDRKKPKTPQ